MDTYPISSNSLEKFFHINGDQLGQQYKEFLSDYRTWDQKEHADKWLTFPQNIGPRLSIDETSLSNGELYTILTNKDAKGRKGAIVAMAQGTTAESIIKVIQKIPQKQRAKVSEITLDMAGSMNLVAKKCFPNAEQVIDRFHVQKLAFDALQEIRIAHRWEAINEETNEIENCKADNRIYKPKMLKNGETKKQLLFRSRYLLFKSPNYWTVSQRKRAKILFKLYPDIRQAFSLVHSLRCIYNQKHPKNVAIAKLALWFNKVTDSEFKSFNSISATMYAHYDKILNYFNNRSTNASAESFNAKIKAFRSTQRGVREVSFFLFRLTKIYA
ncbi:MAG TPA: transposase [Prolixibacteraceae bacterium]|nr:transposase [Prolixibacteraceae bacterium]